MAKRRIFAATTPLGYRVVLTRNRWHEIVRFKHPALAGHEEEVRECIQDPEVIRTSLKDDTIHLYYRVTESAYLCVVVGLGDEGQDRFVITAYLTKSIKKGQELWTK